jgi:hypothetical protein
LATIVELTSVTSTSKMPLEGCNTTNVATTRPERVAVGRPGGAERQHGDCEFSGRHQVHVHHQNRT